MPSAVVEPAIAATLEATVIERTLTHVGLQAQEPPVGSPGDPISEGNPRPCAVPCEVGIQWVGQSTDSSTCHNNFKETPCATLD